MEKRELTPWRKSSYSGDNGGGCVEVATAPGVVAVRDSTLGDASPVLTFASEDFTRFLNEHTS